MTTSGLVWDFSPEHPLPRVAVTETDRGRMELAVPFLLYAPYPRVA